MARTAGADAGIVDQDVEPIRPSLDSRSKAAYLGQAREIGRQEFRRAAAFLDLGD